MKQVLFDRYGPPEEVARCADVADVGSPRAGEVVFDFCYEEGMPRHDC
jgi:mitochondrial enoyl-[acyl-carrier protein] reductase / trans-2-enoyl-CoA reductase